MKPWMFVPTVLLAALLGMPAVGRAAGPPERIGIQVPSSPLSPGRESRLTISLLGEKGQPSPTPKALPIVIRGADELGVVARVTVPAGATKVEVTVRAPKPGLWQVEASSPGLASGYASLVCVSPRRMPARSAVTTAARPDIAPTIQTAHPATTTKILRFPTLARRLPASAERDRVTAAGRPAPPPPPAPAPPAEAARPVPASPESIPSAAPPSQGHVELIAQPPKLRRGHDGWATSQIQAFWFEGSEPGQSPRDLSLSLVVDGGDDLQVAPTVLRIPNGQIQSPEAAKISAHRADTAMVRALYPGGQSKPVPISFLDAEPARLVFVGTPELFRGLTSVNTDLYVRLLDDGGQPATNNGDQTVKVNVAVQGPLGVHSYSATVAKGERETRIPIELTRPGQYSIRASAANLGDADPLAVRFALDWLLLASALVGGVLGSLTRVVYRRERVWPKGLPRVLVLGVASALFVLLLSVLGLLSLLGDALPSVEALQKVPASSLCGALLLGFLAGMLFDKVFGRFLGGTGGRRAKPKSGAPVQTPKGVPA